MAVPADSQNQILKLTIEELRRTSDWLNNAYIRMKNKTLTFLTGGFAVLVFLYSSGNLFIPPQVYGKIFYFVGFGLFMIAMMTLLTVTLKPTIWEFSIENKDIEAIKFPSNVHFITSEYEYLAYVKERYYESYTKNLSTYEYLCKWQSRSFIPLLIGAIVLVALKVFGS